MFKKFKKMIVPLLITFLLFSIVVMGAPTYVNIGPTTDFEGDVGVPSGSGYYIEDVLFSTLGLIDISTLSMTDGNFIVGDGTNWIVESGSTARTSLGIDLSLYYLKTEIDTLLADYTPKSLFDAYTILYADTDNTPAALSIVPSRIMGRAATGGIAALDKAAVLEIINVEDGADVTDVANVTTALGSINANALADITSPGANIEDAVTKKHTQNTDTQFDFYNALSSDHDWSGDKDTQPVGESVVFGDLLYPDWTAGEWLKADADLAAKMPGLRIALESKTDGQTCLMLVNKFITEQNG